MDALPLRVLLLDDDPLVAQEIAEALERAGAIVIGPLPNRSPLLRRFHAADGVEVAVLRLTTPDGQAFPAADVLAQERVPLIFYAQSDDITLPSRHSRSVRISEARGISDLVQAVFEHRVSAATDPSAGSARTESVFDLLPELRLLARRLTGDPDVADDLVERALEAAIAALERGRETRPLRQRLTGFVIEAYRQCVSRPN